MLGLSAEMYVYGTQLWCIVIADSFVSLTMVLIYLPVFYGLQITSSYEVHDRNRTGRGENVWPN